MSAAKYGFHLSDEGVMRVVKTSGEPITEEEVQWFRETVRNQLRSESLTQTVTHVRAAELAAAKGSPTAGETRGGVKFEIDPAVLELEEIRERHGYTKRALAAAMFTHGYQITDWVRGNSRPHMFNLRTWAAVLNRVLMLVPTPLKGQVRAMVNEWEAANEPPRKEEKAA